MTEEFFRVARAHEVPDGQVKVFEVSGTSIALCNAQGKFFAVADLCSHDDGPLGDGELIGCQIECPRHGARFDVKTGKAMCLPAVTAIPAYETELRDDDVWVKMPVKD